MRYISTPLLAPALAAACTGTPTDSAPTDGAVTGTCINGPSVEITAPENAAVFEEGEAISLVAEGSSEVDDADHLKFLWSYYDVHNSGAEGNIGTKSTQSWTPPGPGDWRIIVQVEDSCISSGQVELGQRQQADVRVTVTALDSGGA
jgi:hypothetical protein